MRDIIRPKRELRNSRHNRKYTRKKRHWFVRLIWRLFVLVLIISILPMMALRYYDPPTSSFIQLNIRNNNTQIKHQWKDIEMVSEYFPLAVIASEDQQFPDHFGFDINEIQKVLQGSENGLSRGASTISQQTIKNLFLWPGRSFIRKGIEAWLTLWLELIVPKKRILELYINFAQFGKSVFGIGAASQHYFKLDASELNLEQSALIAATLPTPSRSNPAKPSDYLKQRAAFIADQMPRIGGRRLIREL